MHCRSQAFRRTICRHAPEVQPFEAAGLLAGTAGDHLETVMFVCARSVRAATITNAAADIVATGIETRRFPTIVGSSRTVKYIIAIVLDMR
jgi:hypothetical protein